MREQSSFLWVDGARPKLQGVDAFVAGLVDLNYDEYILQLSSPNQCRRWSDPVLRDTTKALVEQATPSWMLWAHADEAKCYQQIAWLKQCFRTWPIDALPISLQWDAEYQWEHAKFHVIRKCTVILAEGMRALRNILDARTESCSYLTFSITAISEWPKPQLDPAVQYLIDNSPIMAGYSQCYKFYNSAKGHWSQGMPTVEQVIDTIHPAWEASGLNCLYMGLAAHMQRWPNDPDPQALTNMRRGYTHATTKRVVGIGHWSWKALKRHTGKRNLVTEQNGG